MENTQKIKYRKRAFRLAIFLSAILSFAKLLVGFLTNNLSVIAMGVDSFFDILFTNLNYFSVRIAEKPADEDHPMGHGKFEDFSTLIQSMIIFFIGAYILYSAVEGFFIDRVAIYDNTVIIVMLLSTIGAAFISYVLKHAGKITGSSAMVADALHYTSDIVTNGAILVGIIAARVFDIGWMDNALGAVFSIYIMYSAYTLFRGAFGVLTDCKIPDELENKIVEVLKEHKNIMLDYHKLSAIRSGSHYIVNLHIVTCKNLTLEHSHEIADHIEHELADVVPSGIITVHLDPCDHKREGSAVCKRVRNSLTEHGLLDD